MFVKITMTALIALIVRSTGGMVWDGFTASWSSDTSTHFYSLPKTLKAAKDEGWTYVSGLNPPKGITPMCYNGDLTFTILFAKDKAVGFQVALLVSDVQNSGQLMKYDKLDAVITKKINGELYYTATTYFSKDESKGIRRLWFQEKNRCQEIPTIASLVLSKTQFLSKKCVPTMGTHYYTWNATSDCATLHPWFLLGDKNNIIGVGFQGSGTATTLGLRKWWETLPDDAIHAAMSDPPPCTVNDAKKYGTISLHIWFTDKPKKITCN